MPAPSYAVPGSFLQMSGTIPPEAVVNELSLLASTDEKTAFPVPVPFNNPVVLLELQWWEFEVDGKHGIVSQVSAHADMEQHPCRASKDASASTVQLPDPQEYDVPLVLTLHESEYGNTSFSALLQAPPAAPVFATYRPPTLTV